jgi:hypothetical protein
MREDEKDVKDVKGGCGHGQEVDGGRGAQVIVEESRPGLRGRLAWIGGQEADTLRLPTSMPSLSSSPWILGAPHPTLPSLSETKPPAGATAAARPEHRVSTRLAETPLVGGDIVLHRAPVQTGL